MVWKPHVTVAAVIENNDRFLLVEEMTSGGIAFNQPAGHLEEGESLIDAIQREVLEETTCIFQPESIIAVQLYRKNAHSKSFLRICFSGQASEPTDDHPLDEGIIKTHWLCKKEIEEKKSLLRSPLVISSIIEYQKGHYYPLSLLHTLI